MERVRFNHLLASTALGLVLVLASHPGMAQQAGQQQIDAAAPAGDTTPPPAAAKDAGAAAPAAAAPVERFAEPAQTAPAKNEPVQAEAAKPEPAQNATAPAAAPAPAPAEKVAEPAKSEPAQSKPAQAEAAKPEPAQNAAAPAAAPAPAEKVATPVAEPAKPQPAVAAAPAISDQAVADKLREMITAKNFERMLGRKVSRAGVEAFYSGRNYAPLWVANGAADARAKSAIAYLANAEAVGLDSSDYPTPHFGADMNAEALAAAEIKLTAAALTFARDAQVGRIHFSRVSSDIDFKLAAPEPAAVLAKLAGSDDAAKVLDSFNPPQAEFKALKAALAELRKNGDAPAKVEKEKPAPVKIADGKILRLGMKDERVVALRKRLNVPGDKNSPLYDEAVRDAVVAFQERAEIGVDGNVGPNTVRALNGDQKGKSVHRSLAAKIDTIVVNMERWRWFPRDLGNPHVVVNVPDYTLTLWDDGKVYWHTKIVVGKPGTHATPMTSAEMKYITVNPTWNVPPSIIEHEYLPALEQDPTALERIGLKVEQAPDGTVRIYQPPGAGNALGRIRFNFPNKFLVYQHDTPDKYLFAKEKRAYSHGCMRVQNPLTYGEKLLSLALPKEHYTEAKLERMFGSNEVNINFPKPIWVHLTYQTAFVDPDGKLQFRDDVYGRDEKMLSILKGSERKVADIPVERPPNTSAKPVRMPVGMFGGERDSGPNFFDWLFNGGRPQESYRQQRGFIGPRAGVNGRYTYR